MKKNYWYLILGLVVLAIVMAVIIGRSSKSPAGIGQVTVNDTLSPISEVQAQTYLASSSPSVKDNDKIFGSASAVLNIFVYEDYSSLFSAVLADTLDKIKAESGDRLAVIVRPYVTSNSVATRQLAQAVDCAGEQGKWKEMRAILFAQAKNQQLLNDNLASYITQLNLNNEDFNACLTKGEKSGKIEQLVTEAQSYGVQGAPTMFIGEEIIIGARPYEDFVDSNGDKIIGLKSVVDSKLGR